MRIGKVETKPTSNTADKLPAGMAKVLPKGAKLVMQVHYHKTGKPETDRRNARVVIDACKPFARRDTFPVVARSSKELDARIQAKWAADLPK